MAEERATQFTLGKLKAHPASSIVGSLISYGDISKGENLAVVMPQKDIRTTEAYAHLFAATPELLEALQAMLDSNERILKSTGVCVFDKAVKEQAEAAVKKATERLAEKERM
jgi:hypothetical protein